MLYHGSSPAAWQCEFPPNPLLSRRRGRDRCRRKQRKPGKRDQDEDITLAWAAQASQAVPAGEARYSLEQPTHTASLTSLSVRDRVVAVWSAFPH